MPPTVLTTIENAVCTFCGCSCDDIELDTDGERVLTVRNACSVGEREYLTAADVSAPPALIDGQPASLEAAVVRAAEILGAARAPLVYGLEHSTCESQRVAVALADRLGGYLDTPASLTADSPGMFFPDIGEVTCSLGEVKNRADLIVYWGGDPARSHPRLAKRYGHDAIGEFTPLGRADRTVIVVGSPESAGTFAADQFMALTPVQTFEALWLLRALVQGKRPAATNWPRLDDWSRLAERLRACRFGVLFLGSAFGAPDRVRDLEAAYGLATDLNARARFYVLPLRGAGNPAGAEQVLTWQSGFPSAVGFQNRAPRHFAAEFTAWRLLARREVDAVLAVNADLSALPAGARARLNQIPIVSLSSRITEFARSCAVVLFTAPAALTAAGTVFRLDEIALPLRTAIRSSFPGEDQVLRLIAEQLRGRSATESSSNRMPGDGQSPP